LGIRVASGPESLWQAAFHVTFHVTRAAPGKPSTPQRLALGAGSSLVVEIISGSTWNPQTVSVGRTSG
jgi:hypothetical protein